MRTLIVILLCLAPIGCAGTGGEVRPDAVDRPKNASDLENRMQISKSTPLFGV